jgi:hypothetical protein
MLVDEIERAYAEFDVRSASYVPIRGRTAQATIYDEIWDNNLTSAAFTTMATASTAASNTAAVNTALTPELLRRQMDEMSIQMIENPYINGAYLANAAITARQLSIPSFDWNDMTTDDVHPNRMVREGIIMAARSSGKTSLMSELWKKHVPKPPEPTGPQQLDLFD